MCGLCGDIRFDGSTADLDAVARMVCELAPRGPDGEGAWSDGRVAFGHRRLSVIDLSENGAQPMVDDELGLIAVFNGCVYDHAELRAELQGHGYRFRSTSDTEVILKGYHHWGTDVVDHLHGMFAFVVHERDTGRVVLARDRLGIKPLYLAETPGRLRFASTLPALLRSGGIDTSIDPVALHHYLSWHAVVPAPRTVLAGVRKLPPATVRVVEADGRSTERRYWQPAYERRPEHAGWSARDWEDAVEEALRVAVRRRLVADIPVGVLLSGGLDSSLIVGLLAQEGQTGLATFSIGFDAVAGQEGDEFRYSDVIADHFGTDHHRIRVGSDELVGSLGHAIGAMSEPMVSHDVVAFDLLSERVSRSIRVVQSGQGADEVFAGYHWYPPLAGVGRADAVDAYARAFFDRDDSGMRAVVGDRYALDHDPSRAFVAEHLRSAGAETAVDAALRLDSEVMLVDDPVKRVDNMSMAWGLEARVPFLGVGEALARVLAERYAARGRSYLDLSVLHDNAGAIALYRKLGFRPSAAVCVKRKNPINRPLFAGGPDGLDQLNPYARVIAEEALRRGIRVEVTDPHWGELRLSACGRTVVTRESLSQLTSAVAMSRCDDKRVTRRILERAGVRVPRGAVAAEGELSGAVQLLEQCGRVVVKPARGEQGRGITVGVDCTAALEAAVHLALQHCPDVLVEELVPGDDLRVVVIDHEVVAAAVRRPAEIVGDGRRDVAELIRTTSRRRERATGGESTIPLDDVTAEVVAAAGWSLDDVLPCGTRVQVRRTANLHTGGTITDVTDRLHPAIADAAVRASRAIDIPLTGLDFMVPDVAGPEHVFIEANERPGLANHEPQPTVPRFVDLLFPETRRR